MIRRKISVPGTDKTWALISQVQHARLAADLARRWKPLLPPSAEVDKADEAGGLHGELLAAIEHHDDGWAEWEEAPEIDPEHARPRSFTEMPQIDSLAIWSKSIAVAEQIGPLAAWVVSRHFAALLQGSNSGSRRSDLASPAASWLDLQRSRQDAWMQAWLRAGSGHTSEIAEDALRALQFFDAASLWFCCTCPTHGEPPPKDEDATATSWTYADGTTFRFTPPSERAIPVAPRAASILPWPLDAAELQLSAECHLAPQRRYLASSELIQAWQPHSLSWRLAARDDR